MDLPGSPSTLAKAIGGVGLRGRAAGSTQLCWGNHIAPLATPEVPCGSHPADHALASLATSSICHTFDLWAWLCREEGETPVLMQPLPLAALKDLARAIYAYIGPIL